MNWQQQAIDDLKKHLHRKAAVVSMEERIEILDSRYESAKRPRTGGGGSGGSLDYAEESRLANIMERERLTMTLDATKRLVELTEQGLEGLTDVERLVLDIFYISPCEDRVGHLMQALNYERSQVYRTKDAALHKFVVRMYGLGEY